MNPTRVTITMPPLGEDVTEATISGWLIATGDAIDATPRCSKWPRF